MNHRTIALLLLMLLGVAVGVGFLLYHHPDYLGICATGLQCLSQDVLYGIAHPLYLHLWPLGIVFAALAFVRREVFMTWAKIIPVLSIIALAIAINSAPVPHGFFLDPSRADVTRYLVRAILTASLAVIGIKYGFLYIKERRRAVSS